MDIGHFVDSFINQKHFEDPKQLRKARLFVKGCFLTSLFSNSYIWLSLFFEFEKGVFLMICNVLGFILLPFLAKTRLPISWIGNVYVFMGAFAVVVLTYFSGGVWSAVYPWIVAVPILALLVVNKLSGAIWGIISMSSMVCFGAMAYQGIELPVEYNPEMRTLWYITVLPGLLLIILFIGFVFESVQTRALRELEQKNQILENQKKTISSQSSTLAKLIDEKEYIIRIMAHDLRNPLANIQGFSGMIGNQKYLDQKEELIEMVKQAASNALYLIKRVLEMDSADREDLKIEFEQIDIVFLLSELVKTMAERAREKQIMINLKNQAKHQIVLSEKIYLTQIFDNLLSNAIKFSEYGKRITVVVAENYANLQVKVIDEGPGIRPEEEGKLFKKFSKLSTRPTGNESSTGLGLSLVRRYVELVKGKIWYDGEFGKGSVFVVELPAYEMPQTGIQTKTFQYS